MTWFASARPLRHIARLLVVAGLLAPASSPARAAPASTPSAHRADSGDSSLIHGDPAAARSTLERKLDGARLEGDLRAVTDLLLLHSEACVELGDLAAAAGSAQEGLAGARTLGETAMESRALIALGDVDFYRYDFPAAGRSYAASLALSRAAGDRAGEAGALKSLGIARKYLGEFEESIDDLEESLRLHVELHDPAGQVSSLENLGGAYVFLGDYPRALQAYLPALDIVRGLDEWHMHHILLRIGSLYLSAGFPERALPSLLKAAEIADRRGLALQQEWALATASQALERLGRHEEAMGLFRRARRLDGRDSVAGGAPEPDSVGWLHLVKDPSRALEIVLRALSRGDRSPDSEPWRLHALAADSLMRLGRLDEAIDHYESSVGALESVQASILSEHYRSTYRAQHEEIYQHLVQALLARERARGSGEDASEAFEALERGRARVLLSALGPAGDGGGSGRMAAGARESLALDEAVVSYLVAPEGLVGFVVTTGGVRAVALPGDETTLGRRIENYVEMLAGGDEASIDALGARLSRDLLEPLFPFLPRETHHLIFVPDGALHILPFETLPSPGGGAEARPVRRLVEGYAVSYAPSAVALSRLGAPRSGPDTRRDLLMLAAPTVPEDLRAAHGGATPRLFVELFEQEGLRLPGLPNSALEADQVSRFVGRDSEIDVGPDASEARFKAAALDRFRIVHLAAHGLVSPLRPDRSALLLASSGGDAEDGLLHAFEIRRLGLDADLVVLSACRTARGRVVGGEGAQGLARAFLAAGARSVLASLSSVDDEHTARLMESFYEGLAGGLTEAEALRRAKLAMKGSARGGAFRHWAPFVLIGRGNAPIHLDGRAWWDPGGPLARGALAAGGPIAILCGGLLMAAALRSGRSRRPRWPGPPR